MASRTRSIPDSHVTVRSTLDQNRYVELSHTCEDLNTKSIHFHLIRGYGFVLARIHNL